MFPGPLLLFLGPVVIALIAFLLRGNQTLTAIVGGALVCMWMLILSVVPLDLQNAGLFSGDSLFVFGRPFVLTEGTRAVILLIAAGVVLLCVLSALWQQSVGFVPAAIVLLTPISAMLTAQPLTLSALTIVPIGACIVWLLFNSRASSMVTLHRSSLVYLTLLTVAASALLVVGWTIETDQVGFASSAWRLFALGSTIVLAGFPFYWWTLHIAETARPFAIALVLGLVQLVMVVFVASMVQRNSWLTANTPLNTVLVAIGGATVGIALLLAALLWLRPAASWSIVRLIGYFVLLDMGLALVSLGSGSAEMLPHILAQHVMRFIALLFIGIGLARRENMPDTTGSGSELTDDSLGTLLLTYGVLALAGLPLTPLLVPRWRILQQLTASTGLLMLTLATIVVLLASWLRWLWSQRDRANKFTDALQHNPIETIAIGTLLAGAIFLSIFPVPLLNYIAAATIQLTQ